jgi:multidrug efflux pump subunit AcrA (membrane-fusion protein)
MRQYKNRFALFFSLAALAGPGCKNAATAPVEEAAPAVQTPVTVTGISREPMEEYIELNATSAFLLKSYVKANANGYLQQSALHIGQLVHKGDLLFTLKTKEAQSIGNAVNLLDSSFKFSGTNHIKAGESGYISMLDHQPGDYVQDGEQLAVISNTNSFAFILNLPYELRPYLLKTKQVTLELPDGEKLAGTISAVMPVVDSVSQTQRITIVTRAGHAIPENLLAKVRIPKTVRPNAVSLPKAAVLTDETQSAFWIMKMIDSATAVKVMVKKGLETGGKVEILSPPLADSDKILISGHYGLGDTARVSIIPTLQQQPE